MSYEKNATKKTVSGQLQNPNRVVFDGRKASDRCGDDFQNHSVRVLSLSEYIMGKRFTATEIWDNPQFIDLSKDAKLLWFFLKDKCDNAGVVGLSRKLVNFHIEPTVDIDEVANELAEIGWIKRISDSKWWIPNFVRFQCGILKESCKPHKSVMRLLEQHGLLEDVLKGYPKSMITLKEKEEEREEEQEKDKDKEKEVFDISRKLFKGTKRGIDTEFANLKKKHKDWKTVLPLIESGVLEEIDHRTALKKDEFFPAWKNFSTWINNRCWEQEFAKSEKGTLAEQMDEIRKMTE